MPLAPLFVLSGPSGAGKSTVVEAVLKACHYRLRRAVTATSREPRAGEVPEVDYHYWTEERFQQALAAGEMLEHAIVFGRDHYGTPKSEVDDHRKAGVGVLLVIDVQGAAQVRAKYPNDHRSIFLAVPSLEELERRLRGRGTEGDEKIARRLRAAAEETARQHEFDAVIVNDTVPNAARQLLALIESEFTRRPTN
jgi:guanylate kinase